MVTGWWCTGRTGGGFSDERAAPLLDSVNERAFSKKGLTNCSKFDARGRPRANARLAAASLAIPPRRRRRNKIFSRKIGTRALNGSSRT